MPQTEQTPQAEPVSEIDLTNGHLPTLESVDLPATLTALDVTANRLREIDPRVLNLEGLVSLNFRQNLLTDVSCFDTCKSKASIQDVDFRDNHLTQIPSLSGFSQLRRIEFSYNEIRSLAPLSSLCGSPLQELLVAANKVTSLAGVDGLTALTQLEAGSNRLRDIAHAEQLTNLRELWLGRNRLAQLDGFGSFHSLVKLSVQSNRLDSMCGLEACTALEELYLCHNGITALEGLSTLTRLHVLDVSSNRVSALCSLAHCRALSDLWLNDNALDDWEATRKLLEPLAPTLTTVYLEGNPLAKAADYPSCVRALLPNLEQMDANALT